MVKINNAKILIACLVILNALSLLALYSSLHQAGEFRQGDIFTKQILWIIIFWIVLIVFSFINYRIYYEMSIPLFIICILLLIGVRFFGREVMGAQRWYMILGFGFQPSEFAKIAVVMLLARFFSSGAGRGKRIILMGVLLPFLLVGIVSFLIFKQPDLGTAGILILVFFMMGMSSKIKKRYFVALIIAGMALAPFAWWHLKDYQKQRLVVFMNPDVDPLGAGYTIIQSKIAVGSGELFGKGFLSGTQNQFNFLPERHTDFIFTVIAEEFGFAGCIFLLLIYYLVLRGIMQTAKSSKDGFAQFLCVGIYSLLFLHIIVNIGMTMGIIPVVGLPLLGLSYGGTHLFMTAFSLGVYSNIVRQC